MKNFSFSLGQNIRDNRPEQHHAESFRHFSKMTLSGNMGERLRETPKAVPPDLPKKERNKLKEALPYICPPMSGDGHRCKENAQDWSVLMLDIDEIAVAIDDPSDISRQVIAELQQMGPCFGYTTSSHTENSPRIRVLLELSMNVTAKESQAIATWVLKELNQRLPDIAFVTNKADIPKGALSRVLVDTSMQDAAHVSYLPCGDFTAYPLRENPPPPLSFWDIPPEDDTEEEYPVETRSYPPPSGALIESALEYIDPDLPRNDWRDCVFAIRSTGLQEARQIAEDWSRKGDKFDQSEFDKLWNGPERTEGVRITIATLFHHAKQNGWRDTLPLGTDLQNALAFLAEHSQDFIYSPLRSSMFVYDERRGKLVMDDKDILTNRRITEFANKRRVWAEEALKSDPDNPASKTARKAACALCQRKGLDAARKYIQDAVTLTDEIGTGGRWCSLLDSHACLLNTPAGTVEITADGCELRKHRREDMLTMQTAVTPDFTRHPEEFLRVLHRACSGNDELVTFLQYWFGACTIGFSKPHVVMLLGQGRDGKSLISTTFAKILGDYAVTSKAAVFGMSRNGNPNGPEAEILKLLGRRYVTVPEVSSSLKLNLDLMKQLTGGDGISARGMYEKTPLTFAPTAGVHMYGNSLPVLSGQQGHSLHRRFSIVPFTNPVSEDEDDPTLFQRLFEMEGPAILGWVLEGASAYLKNSQQLLACTAVREFSKNYVETADPVRDWFNEETRPLEGQEQGELIEYLYSRYKSWTTSSGHMPLSKNRFASWLVAQGVRQNPSRKTGRRYDIALISKPEDHDFTA